MSVQAISAVLAMRGVGPAKKMVLMALANYADENGRCWPSNARIADECGVSRRQVIRVLKELETEGFIARTPDERRDGSQSASITDLLLLRGDNLSPTGDISVTPPVTPVSPLTTFEPSLEPSTDLSEPTVPHPALAEPAPLDSPLSKPKTSEPVRHADIDRIWAATPRMARERSSKADLGRALRAAVNRGGVLADIEAALTRFHSSRYATADDCKAMRGVHRSIQEDRWKDWVATAPSLTVVADELTIAHRLKYFHNTGEWKSAWGDPPADYREARA